MLQTLRIENVAVVERAEIAFGPGLNVLTGETGAGKSIIIDSISAVTGARVSRELIRAGADRAVVTAVFDRDAAVDAWLRENEIDPEDEEIILQRRVASDGRSSCRISGCPVTAGQLRALGGLLVELHGQNEGARLQDEGSHLAALDRFAALDPGRYREAYARLLGLRREREQLDMDELEKERMQELLTETVRELEDAAVTEGEYDTLSERRDLLRNAEKLTEVLGETAAALSSEEGALSRTQEATWACRRAASMTAGLAEVAEKLEQAEFLLSDAAETLQDFEESLNFSPEEYDRLEQRLQKLSRLERRYRRPADELPAYLDECRKKLSRLQFSDVRLQELTREIERQERICEGLAEELHAKRVAAADALSEQIEGVLHELSMPHARFLAEVDDAGRLTEDGRDAVRFLLAANPGEPPGRLSRIASGGELSRIMLALRSVLSNPVGTMIFDEIDTGVSGIAAQRVGEKLSRLSRDRQVLCVTHLPQLASLADAHYMIRKAEADGRTRTEVLPLDRGGRQRELARLHGGDHVTETTLRSAEEQLRWAEEFKNGGTENGSI